MIMLKDRLKRIAIIGLGWTGQSLGLTLRQALPAATIIGHDRDPDASKAAQEAGAVHKTHWNLISATDGAEAILLALPAHEALATMRALAPELATGVLITDTAAVKAPLAAWARDNFPTNVYYVGGHPLGRKTAKPSATAFAGTTYCLTPTPEANPGAVSAVTEFVGILRANAVFLDPVEHDSLMVGLQYLPVLAAAITVQMLEDSRARKDLHRLREAVPAEVISLAEQVSDVISGEAPPASKEALLHWLDRHIAALNEVRATVNTGDSDQLKEMLEKAEATIGHWLPQSRDDSDESSPETSPQGGSWRRLLGMR